MSKKRTTFTLSKNKVVSRVKLKIMKTITVNQKKYSVTTETAKFLNQYKNCNETFSFIFNLGMLTGSIVLIN